MQIIPAVDILDGKVCRLFKGSFEEKKEYSGNPVEVAQYWQSEGAEYLHVVDLDGAKSGKPKNLKVIKEVIKSLAIPVEIGGGIRTLEAIKAYINFGADRVVLGTAVINDLSFLDEAKDYAGKIAIGTDPNHFIDNVKLYKVGTSGWIEETYVQFPKLMDKMNSLGISYLNYTIRSKDGTLSGLAGQEISSLESFLGSIRYHLIKVIYAGGIASLEDIKKLKDLENNGLLGVIVGKALYEKKFSLKEAQDIVNVS